MRFQEHGMATSDPDELYARFQHLASRHADRVSDELLLQRLRLFEAASANPQGVLRGEFGAFAAPQHNLLDSQFPPNGVDHLLVNHMISLFAASINRRRETERTSALLAMRSAGDLRPFVALANEMCPGVDEVEAIALARQLLNAELSALARIDLPPDLSSVASAPVRHPCRIDRPFPPPVTTSSSHSGIKPVSMDDVFECWRLEAQPKASTLSTWGGHKKEFNLFHGVKAFDLASITPHDMVRWKNHLVQGGKAASTISRSYFGFARTMFRFAVNNKLLNFDPSEGIKVSGKAKAGTKMLPYSSDEITTLQRHAARADLHWKRFLLPLAVFTGARIGELAQLHGSHIGSHDGIAVVNIKPAVDGGSIKNVASERMVPLHDALLACGFLAFVAERGAGPLFYDRTSGDPTRKHASKAVTNRLAAWVRQLGFRDPRKAPNHAIRHWFKTECARLKIEDSIVDAIQGHHDMRSAATYRHISVEMMREAINRIQLPP